MAFTASPSVPVRAESGPAREFLPHVQGLRAIAVLLVVIYHFWPARLPGGYVGVDVFFVISGFLITAHLTRELLSSGSVKLGQFWARRARRLLPASLLVLLVCAVVAGSAYLMPTSGLPAQLREIIAATFYVENWYLAFSSADYLGNSGDATMVQHYWSLSLEEQFYVLWPLLLLAAAALATRFFRGARLRTIIIAIAAVSVVSLLFSVLFTLTNPAPAYFVTFTRMWQFGVGSLLALLPVLRVQNAALSFVIGWAGIAALIYTAFTFDGQTLFPGYAALLPTLGAAAVIAASQSDRWWQPARVLSIRPAQFTGDISYSLYLWHWPLIIIAPSVPFWGLTIYHRVALLALCFVLAWLTKRFVEDPMRSWKPLTTRRPATTLWTALGAMLLVTAVVGGSWLVNAQTYRDGAQAIAQLRANPPECFGAASVLDPGCTEIQHADTILPAPGFAGMDRPESSECFVQLNDSRPVSCEFGTVDPEAPRVLLIGDSHAYQLLPTFQEIAEREGWSLLTYFKGACPWSTAPLAGDPAFASACEQWRAAVAGDLSQRTVDVVFTAALATTPFAATEGFTKQASAVDGYRDAWSAFTEQGIPVVTVVDNPVWESDPNKCLRTRPLTDCSADRSAVLVSDDPLRLAAEGQADITLLDFTEVYCDSEFCHPVVGGANIYRDQDHLTVTFADSLAPQYVRALRDALEGY